MVCAARVCLEQIIHFNGRPQTDDSPISFMTMLSFSVCNQREQGLAPRAATSSSRLLPTKNIQGWRREAATVLLCNATMRRSITSEMSESTRYFRDTHFAAYSQLQMECDNAGRIHPAVSGRLCGSQVFLLRVGACADETLGGGARRADARQI